jgi:hypothetical protein
MDFAKFGKFSSGFGLLNTPSGAAAERFLRWQNEVLLEWGFNIKSEVRGGKLSDALNSLLPRTAPIITKFLMWPLNDQWTLYFDNGHGGTDSGPPQVLSKLLEVDAMRIVMAPEIRDKASVGITEFGATIFEYYVNGIDVRHVYAANDGGRWKFGEHGDPFLFEDISSYNRKLIKRRFTSDMLLGYLKELGADLCCPDSDFLENGEGYFFTKHGKMPSTFIEVKD